MNRLLFTVGIFLVLIWMVIALISLGLPESACDALKAFTSGAFSSTIDTLHNGFYYDIPNRNMPTVVFIILFSLAFFFYFAVSVRIGKYPGSAKSFAIVIHCCPNYRHCERNEAISPTGLLRHFVPRNDILKLNPKIILPSENRR